MRALAEFIMRGRREAGMVAILGYVIPLLAPVAVALVTLRKGTFEGTLVLLFGLSPALLSLVFSEASSVAVWVTLLSLIVVYVPALVLRSTVSLSMMAISVIAVSSVVTGAILLLAPDAVAKMVDSLVGQLSLSDSSGQAETAKQSLNAIATTAGVSGIIAYVLAVNSLVGVLIGRWLQALAFNPGGFGKEFYELRLNVISSVVLFVGSVVLHYQGSDYWWWSNILAIPLLLVAIAIAHQVVSVRKLAKFWLVLFYLMVFMVMPFVKCIGFLDAWVNFRDRWNKQQ